MEITWNETIAKENFQLYDENRNSRRVWEADAVRFDDFRYGQHFSKAEERELLAFRQAPLPISITTAICDTAEALMTASKPVIRVAPIINPYDEKLTTLSKNVAQRYNYVIQKSWYDSLGGLHYDRVVRDYTNVGVGYFYANPSYNYGEFNVNINHISWRYVYPHKMSKDPFFRDMDNAVIAMEVSKMSGYKIVKSNDPNVTWEEYEEEFVKKNRYGITGSLNPTTRYQTGKTKDDSLPFIVRLVLEERNAFAVVPTTSEYVGKQTVKFYPELTADIKQGIKEGKYTYRETKKFFLTEYLSVGGKGCKKTYPISQYNLVPLVYDHRDSPYPYGRIWYLYPIQRALNKFIMIALLNGALINATRVMAEDKSIVDEYEWQKNFAKPGGKLLYKLMTPGQSIPPQIIEGKPLGDAWLQMPRYLAYIMEYISGIFGAMMGDSKDAPDVFSTVAALQSAGGQKIKRRLAQADASLSILGNVVGEFYKEYAPLNGYSSIIDENGEQKDPMTYNVLRPTKDDPQKIEIDPETDLSIGFKEVRFSTQASNGFESGTEAALLTNLATQLKIPQLVPLILKRLNMADVDKITDEMKITEQQAGQMKQMEQTIQDLDGRIKVLANKVTEKSFELSKTQFDAKFKEILAEFKNNPEMLNQMMTQGSNGNG